MRKKEEERPSGRRAEVKEKKKRSKQNERKRGIRENQDAP
jgi:hypothetical protein